MNVPPGASESTNDAILPRPKGKLGAVPGSVTVRRWPAIAGGFLVVAAVLLVSPLVLGDYAQQILSQAFFFAIAAVTVDLLWGYTGILTFGQSAFFGVGVYTVALALAYYVEGTAGTTAAVLGAMAAAALLG